MTLEDILHKLTDSVSLSQAERDDIHAAVDAAVKVAVEAAVTALTGAA